MWHIKNHENVCREVDEVREERFGRRIEHDRFRREREKLIKKDKEGL